jgi:CMP-N-acetylneuraminic acid synthetase
MRPLRIAASTNSRLIPMVIPSTSSPSVVSSSNGENPTSMSRPTSVASSTASTERRPSGPQYTSSSRSHRANSSSVSAAPMPNSTESTSNHGLAGR